VFLGYTFDENSSLAFKVATLKSHENLVTSDEI